MNRHFRRIAVAALLAVAGLVVTPPAQATTIAPLSLEQYVDASTYIVQGKVLEQWTTLDNTGTVWTHAKVAVSETYKGEVTPDEVIVSAMGGVYGDTILEIPGRAVYSDGEQVLLFLYADPENGRVVTVGMWTGKYTIRRAPGERRHHLLRMESMGAAASYDHRFLPHPPQERRVYLDDVLDTVDHRLAEGWDGKPIPGLSDATLRRINTPTARRINR